MSDTRKTRATAKLDSSPQSNANANKMIMVEIRRLKGDMITKKKRFREHCEKSI